MKTDLSNDTDSTSGAEAPLEPEATIKARAKAATRTGGQRTAAARRRSAGAESRIRPRTASSPTTKSSSTGRRRLPRLVPWGLALLGLVGTVGFALAWQSARNDPPAALAADGPAADMVEAADGFTMALTNFDGATVDRDFDAIVARSTGEFRDQADEFFSSDTRKQLKEAQASSRGEIRTSYVQSYDGERGTVFVVADQTIANNASPQPVADTLRMELGLVRTDGRWLVKRVDVLSAPLGGSSVPDPSGALSADGN